MQSVIGVPARKPSYLFETGKQTNKQQNLCYSGPVWVEVVVFIYHTQCVLCAETTKGHVSITMELTFQLGISKRGIFKLIPK